MTNPNHPWLDAISAQEGDPDPRVVDAVPAGVIIQETNDGPEVVNVDYGPSQDAVRNHNLETVMDALQDISVLAPIPDVVFSQSGAAEHWYTQAATKATRAGDAIRALGKDYEMYVTKREETARQRDIAVEALREARTDLSITRSNIMVEMNNDCRAAYQWEGVPEKLKERLDEIDAALKACGVSE